MARDPTPCSAVTRTKPKSPQRLQQTKRTPRRRDASPIASWTSCARTAAIGPLAIWAVAEYAPSAVTTTGGRGAVRVGRSASTRNDRRQRGPVRPVGVHIRGARTEFDATGRFHHLFDPFTGASAHHYIAVSVLAASAMVADALSTALYVTPPERGAMLLASFSGVSALATLPDGTVQHLPVGS